MPHRIIRSWYTGHWWVGCYIWYEEGPGQAAAPPSPFLALPNVTAHPSTANVPITVLLYGGPLLCGFNVVIKGLSPRRKRRDFTRWCCCPSVWLSVCSSVAWNAYWPIAASARVWASQMPPPRGNLCQWRGLTRGADKHATLVCLYIVLVLSAAIVSYFFAVLL